MYLTTDISDCYHQNANRYISFEKVSGLGIEIRMLDGTVNKSNGKYRRVAMEE